MPSAFYEHFFVAKWKKSREITRLRTVVKAHESPYIYLNESPYIYLKNFPPFWNQPYNAFRAFGPTVRLRFPIFNSVIFKNEKQSNNKQFYTLVIKYFLC